MYDEESFENCDMTRKKGEIAINLVNSLTQLRLNHTATQTHAHTHTNTHTHTNKHTHTHTHAHKYTHTHTHRVNSPYQHGGKERCCTQLHGQEYDKRSMVPESHRVIQPDTVMIHTCNHISSLTAVLTPERNNVYYIN